MKAYLLTLFTFDYYGWADVEAVSLDREALHRSDLSVPLLNEEEHSKSDSDHYFIVEMELEV